MKKSSLTAGAAALACALTLGAIGTPASAAPLWELPGWKKIFTTTLTPGDGWGSAGPGTTGGSGGPIIPVTNWSEFRAALGGTSAQTQTSPRVIVIVGEIMAFAFNDENSPLPTCNDFASQVPVNDGGPARTFTMAEYIAAFDPAVWGMNPPSGPLEQARAQAAALQTAQVRQRVGSNVTIVGMGPSSKLVGAHLNVQGVSNVIIRNFESSDAYDCFPAWDPTDGTAGNWNSLYDNVSVHTTTNVWVNHMRLNDGKNIRQNLPTIFGRKFEVHDGLLDITHSSDRVTASYNVFDNHDKTNLIGSSDSRVAEDTGRLNVTWHHNLWNDVGQRAPRVRFGNVDVYNNVYNVTDPNYFSYFFGAGRESSIYAEKNVFETATAVQPSRFISYFGATEMHVSESLLNGAPIDLLAAYNASAPAGQQFGGTTRWTPTLRTDVTPLASVKSVVQGEAGNTLEGELNVPEPRGVDGNGHSGPGRGYDRGEPSFVAARLQPFSGRA